MSGGGSTSRIVFVSGTDSGVGKTWVGCALARALVHGRPPRRRDQGGGDRHRAESHRRARTACSWPPRPGQRTPAARALPLPHPGGPGGRGGAGRRREAGLRHGGGRGGARRAGHRDHAGRDGGRAAGAAGVGLERGGPGARHSAPRCWWRPPTGWAPSTTRCSRWARSSWAASSRRAWYCRRRKCPTLRPPPIAMPSCACRDSTGCWKCRG